MTVSTAPSIKTHIHKNEPAYIQARAQIKTETDKILVFYLQLANNIFLDKNRLNSQLMLQSRII